MGKIYMIPMNLGEAEHSVFLPPFVLETIKRVRYFIAENAKTARHYFITISFRWE